DLRPSSTIPHRWLIRRIQSRLPDGSLKGQNLQLSSVIGQARSKGRRCKQVFTLHKNRATSFRSSDGVVEQPAPLFIVIRNGVRPEHDYMIEFPVLGLLYCHSGELDSS